jgi:mono/diheme cytochrome c family protein
MLQDSRGEVRFAEETRPDQRNRHHHEMKHRTVFCVGLITFAAAIACAPASNSPGGKPPDRASPIPEGPSVAAPETRGQPQPAGSADSQSSPESHGHHPHAPGEPSTSTPASPAATDAVDAAEKEAAAYEKAKPVFAANCGRCHTSGGDKASKGALRHFDMDSYPFGGHHSSEVATEIRKVLGVNGSKATMPRDKPGAVAGDELQLILEWADAFDRARAQSGTVSEPSRRSHEH